MLSGLVLYTDCLGSQLVIHALACLEQVNLMESITLHAKLQMYSNLEACLDYGHVVINSIGGSPLP